LKPMISVQNFVVRSMSLTTRTAWPSFRTCTGVSVMGQLYVEYHCTRFGRENISAARGARDDPFNAGSGSGFRTGTAARQALAAGHGLHPPSGWGERLERAAVSQRHARRH